MIAGGSISRRLATWLAPAACAVALGTSWAQQEPAPAPEAVAAPRGDVNRGWVVFVSKACARCHAVWGEGGDLGADLGRTRVGGLTDTELVATIWNHVPRMWGKMEEEGIPHVAMSEVEMTDLFAFLSFVRALDEPGDPDSGQRLLREKKCDMCHTVGEGPEGTAPDLSRWARYRNPAVWASVMFEHAPRMIDDMRARGVDPPALEPLDLVHIITYIRSVSATEEMELLDPGDPARGQAVFRERTCAGCHAIRGEGGSVGPELARRGWVSSFTEVAIRIWNHAAGMRAAWETMQIPPPVLAPQDMADLIAYLFAASYSDEPGSPQRGAAALEEKGCTRCHESGIGPSFDKFRGRATPVTIAQALWMHGPTMLERMREMDIRWPSFTGEELRDVIAHLNGPAESAAAAADASAPAPPAEAGALAPAPPAEAGAPAPAATPPQIPHPLDGRDDCLMCHATGGLKPFPSSHEGRTKDMCPVCHQPPGDR